MAIYFFIFFLFAIALSGTTGKQVAGDFESTKSRIAFINYDGSSPVVEGLKSYLGENASIADLQDDEQSLQDALFFRDVEYIVKIPQGFSQDFLNGKNSIKLEKTAVPGSTASMYMDLLIDRYLNTAQIYAHNLPDLTEDQWISMTNHDLQVKSAVQLRTYGKVQNTGNASYYFNFFAYSIMAIVILGVTTIMLIFNNENIRKRNLAAPLKPSAMAVQLILGNVVFGLIVWALMTALSIPIYGKEIWGRDLAFWSANSLVFTLVCLSVSFLVGNLIKSRGAQSAIANVLSLGLCFIGGVFVPQDLLGSTVKTIASFTPTYWYVKANNAIKTLSVVNWENLSPIVYSMLIQLGFAVAILTVSLLVVKQRKVSDA